MRKLYSTACTVALALATSAPAMAQTTLTATLQGSQEVGPTASPGTGTATVALNAAETHITVNMTFSGLTGTTTASHIHGPAPRGVNAGVVYALAIPVGVTSGSIVNQVIAVTPADVQNFKAGLWYINVHTSLFAGGEMRGQLDGGLPIPAMNTRGLLALCSLLAAAGVMVLLRR